MEFQFVAHPNVQQLLAEIWYAAVPGFRRKHMVMQFVQLMKLMMMSPMYSLIYVVAPNSKIGQFISTPFVKFVFHCASYSLFLGKPWNCCNLFVNWPKFRFLKFGISTSGIFDFGMDRYRVDFANPCGMESKGEGDVFWTCGERGYFIRR